MNKFKAIVSETYMNQVKSKSFIALLLMPLIFIIIGAGAGYISYSNASSSAAQDQVAIVGDSSIKKSLVKLDGDSIDSSVKTEKQAQNKIKSDDIYGYVKMSKNNNKIKAQYIGNDYLDSDVKHDLMQTLSLKQNELNISNGGLTKDQIQKLSNKPLFESHIEKQKSENSENNDNGIKMASLQTLIFVLYFFLIMYSSVTASTIAKDKGSKIIEVIFSSTTATKYFLGKIVGIILTLITQLIAYLIMIFAGYKFLSTASFSKDIVNESSDTIHQMIGNFININLAFIVLGLIVGIILSAAAGALVARKEDASKSAQPVVMITLLLFLLSIMFQNNSNSIIPQILSYFPLSSCFFMPIRMINNQANIFEGIISLIILIAFIIGLTYFISKVYKGLMLQNSNEGWFKNLIKGVKYR